MKNILITSNQDQSDLFQFLNEIELKVSVAIHKNVIEVQRNKDNSDDINTALAIYIFNTLHNKLIEKVSAYLNDESDKELIQRLCNNERYNSYIEPLKVLLNQHFKDNKLINLSSFVTFNCRGLEKEIHKIGQDCITIHLAETENKKNIINKTISNKELSSIDMVDSSITYQDYLKRLNEFFIELDTELEFLESITHLENVHIKQVDGVLSLVDENNKNIERTLDEYINFPITQEIENTNETLRLTVILLACIVILKTKNIVFHESTDKDIVAQILVYLGDSKNSNPIIDTVNLFKCNGCDFCY